ncbi:MAG: Nif3-like dinuclear metal center hexameric protein [Gammaproteobacteria bacterium]|nr:MAG: Nif3-like dinuclear metal center hexameric protein [Gammaproteobacteria bacterium]
MNHRALECELNQLLSVEKYSDYAPNGLQVEGKQTVHKVICGVTASLELIEQAIERQADAIIVHHGYFWKGENLPIVGIKQRRIKALLQNDINLYGYHLPLDGHTTLGNNAQLGKLWQIADAAPIAPFDLLWTGSLPGVSVEEFTDTLRQSLARTPLLISGSDRKIYKLAWCSGGAQGFLEKAAGLGADAYVSGEISEKTYHEAREYGMHYFAAGHHATERGGIAALADYLNQHSELACEFIDCFNPV